MLQWTPDDHPPVFDSLEDDVRTQALEQANAFLAKGKHPIRALSMGIAHALDAAEGVSGVATGTPYYVRAETTGHRWQLSTDEEEAPYPMTFDNVDDAVFRASELAREAGSAVYVFSADGGLNERYEFFEGPSNQFTVRADDEGWVVRGHGSHPCHERFHTKQEAVKAARGFAEKHGGSLRVHYKAGGLQSDQQIAQA
ncbi:MAG: DUF2188 domain-containing protein [Deltaproteobacteria bacterium]|nr:DUF2188 domain-containing protein [Deltaproteobacteria bacterium]MCB9785057.1 DUF2188 domain-containing protein [Deltaproteobacteria bacterium]